LHNQLGGSDYHSARADRLMHLAKWDLIVSEVTLSAFLYHPSG